MSDAQQRRGLRVAASVAVHNRSLDLYEAVTAARAAERAARGVRNRRKAAKASEAAQAAYDAHYADPANWKWDNAEMAYGVPCQCGKRISHYMVRRGGEWRRED